MKQIFRDFDTLIEKIRINHSKEEFTSIFTDLKLHANIVFTDFKKNRNSVVLYITNKKQKHYLGFSTSAGLSLFGSSIVWRDIICGKKSLGTSFADGTIRIPNLRINWEKVWKLSFILSTIINIT